MTDRPTSLHHRHRLDRTDPHVLCELAYLRLEAVQALIKVLLDEQPPGDASGCHAIPWQQPVPCSPRRLPCA